jgi:hypothetical protein
MAVGSHRLISDAINSKKMETIKIVLISRAINFFTVDTVLNKTLKALKGHNRKPNIEINFLESCSNLYKYQSFYFFCIGSQMDNTNDLIEKISPFDLGIWMIFEKKFRSFCFLGTKIASYLCS